MLILLKTFLHLLTELKSITDLCAVNFNQRLQSQTGFDKIYQPCGSDFTAASHRNLVPARRSCNFIIVKPVRTFGHEMQTAAKLSCVHEEQ